MRGQRTDESRRRPAAATEESSACVSKLLRKFRKLLWSSLIRGNARGYFRQTCVWLDPHRQRRSGSEAPANRNRFAYA